MALGRDKKQQDAADISDGLASMAFDETVSALDALKKFNFDGGAAGRREHVDVDLQERRALVGSALLGATLLIGIVLSCVITRRLIAQLGGEPRVAARWRARWPRAT